MGRSSANSAASSASFSGSGVIDAPLAMDTARPKVCQSFKNPTHKGSEGRVTGVDFVGKYNSSSLSYTIQTFALNARNATVFPRLSAIATVWRRYYFRRLRFHLFGIAAATQRGYTAMSSLVTDDLATLITPTTESQILNQEQVAIGRPWSYVCHEVNLGGLGLEWYTCDAGDGASEFGEYIGRAFLGIPQTTMDADIEIQVYVEYDVEFCQRIAASLDPICNLFGGTIESTTGVSTSNVLGSSPSVYSGSTGISASSTGEVTIANAGTYIAWATAAGPGLTGPNVPSGTGVVFTGFASFVSGTTAIWIMSFEAVAGAVLDPLTLTGGTPAVGQILIGSVPSGSLSPLLTMKDARNGDDFLNQVARLKMRIEEAKLKR